MIISNKIFVCNTVVIFSNIFFSKSILGFRKWTKINVQNGKPEKSLEKDPL